MDGYFPLDTGRRRTLKAAIGCVGVGVHSGRRVSLTLRPAPAGAGIRFRRTDIGFEVAARFDQVVETRLCTALGVPGEVDIRLFGKPTTRPYRRMGVALALGSDTDDARARALEAAGRVRIAYD